MVDLLAELADRGRSAYVTLTAGRKLAGIVRAVGEDFMILYDSLVGEAIVPFRSLAAVLPGRSVARTAHSGALQHERPLSLFACFSDALSDLAAERAGILAEVAGESLRGELCAAGQDVVTLRLDTAERRHLHVRTNAIDYAVLIRR